MDASIAIPAIPRMVPAITWASGGGGARPEPEGGPSRLVATASERLNILKKARAYHYFGRFIHAAFRCTSIFCSAGIAGRWSIAWVEALLAHPLQRLHPPP